MSLPTCDLKSDYDAHDSVLTSRVPLIGVFFATVSEDHVNENC